MEASGGFITTGIELQLHLIVESQFDGSRIERLIVVVSILGNELDIVGLARLLRNDCLILPHPGTLHIALRLGKGRVGIFGRRRIRLEIRNRQRQACNRSIRAVFLGLLQRVFQRSRDGRRGFLHRHLKRLRIGFDVLRGNRRGDELRGQIIAARIAPGIRHAALFDPLPVARHGGSAVFQLHHSADDGLVRHLALAHVGGVRRAQQELLAVGDGAQLQRIRSGQPRLVDDEGHGGRCTAAVRPAGVGGIGQRERDVVLSGVGVGILRYRIIGGLRDGRLQFAAGVGLRGDGRLRDLQPVCGKRARQLDGFIVGRILRLESQPVFPSSRRRYRIRVRSVEDPVQLSGNDLPVPFDIRLHCVIAQLVLIDQRGRLEIRDFGRGLADGGGRLCAGIAQHVARRVRIRERIVPEVDELVHAGVFIAEGIASAHERDAGNGNAFVVRVEELIAAHGGIIIRQIVAILGGNGHLELRLRIHGDIDLRGRVGTLLVGGEYHGVEHGAVVTALRHGGRIEPAERSADGRFAVHRRSAGQRGVRQRLTVEQARGRGRGQDGRRLRHRQGNVHAARKVLVVVVGIGHGHAIDVGIRLLRFGAFSLLRFGVGDRVRVAAARTPGDELIDQRGDGGFSIAAVGEVRQLRRQAVGNRVHRIRQDLLVRVVRHPFRGVDALADAAGGNDQIDHRLRNALADPADEGVARADWRGRQEGNAGILDGIGRGIFRRGRAVANVVLDGVGNGRPVRRQGQLAGASMRDDHFGYQLAALALRPSDKVVARAGGRGQGDVLALHRVHGGIGRIVLAAVQIVANGVFHGRPAGVQARIGFQHIRSRIEGRGRRAGGARVPA